MDKKRLFIGKLNFEPKKRISKCLVWSIYAAVQRYGQAEAGSFWNVDLEKDGENKLGGQ